jgi:hypothetical protein
MSDYQALIVAHIAVSAALWALTFVTAAWFVRSGTWTSYGVSIFTAAVAASFTGFGLILALESLQ